MNQVNKSEKSKMTAYIFIALTILFTVCGQLLVKSATAQFGHVPGKLSEVVPYLVKAFTNIRLLAGLGCAVLGSITWMTALSTTDISFAYPFMGLAIVLVLALSPLVFKETVPWTRWLGVLIVCIGLWVTAR